MYIVKRVLTEVTIEPPLVLPLGHQLHNLIQVVHKLNFLNFHERPLRIVQVQNCPIKVVSENAMDPQQHFVLLALAPFFHERPDFGNDPPKLHLH